jgi:hypothetical protein
MSDIKLDIQGPFALVGENSILKAPEGGLSGLYLFTFKPKDKHIIEYVGITTRDFKTRLYEHIYNFLSGRYQLYDLEKLKNCKATVVWKGIYNNPNYDINDFLNNNVYYAKIVKQQLQEYSVFIIALNEDRRILERIEGSLYQILRKQNNGYTLTFLKGVRSIPKREETPINVKVETNSLLSEIPERFEI